MSIVLGLLDTPSYILQINSYVAVVFFDHAGLGTFLQDANVLLFPLDVYLCRQKLDTQAYCHTILGPLLL